MQLDFQQFLIKLEKLTDLRPIPDKEFVETYIKAYYLTENDMEQFIKNHRVRQPFEHVHFPFGAVPRSLLTVRAFFTGVLHEAAGQLGERLSGLTYKQEGSSETSSSH